MWQRPNAKPWVTQPDLMVKYQGIVASKHDRLSRADWSDENELRQWAEKNHVALFLVEKELRWPPRPGAQYNDDVDNWNRAAGDSNREWNTTSRRWKRGHRQRESNNHLTGKAPFGYRITGVNCGENPCRCFERGEDDPKQLTIFEPEAKIVRDVVTRYLEGESCESICKDYPRWVPSSLARFLRNPAIAGRRMNAAGKTVLRYEGIITWQKHEEIVARLNSRTHRRGISPANTYMLTGIISCEAGHTMYGIKGGGQWYHYSCRTCGFGVRLDNADAEVTEEVLGEYGDWTRMIKRVIPGKNHFDDIARLRQDRSELDDIAEDYEERHAEMTAEIRRLTKLDKEHPEPNRTGWVKNGITISQHWDSLGTAGRRDWLKENGWSITAIKNDELPNGFSLIIDAGWMAGKSSFEDAIKSLGGPDYGEVYKTAADAMLAEVADYERQYGFRINPDGSRTNLMPS